MTFHLAAAPAKAIKVLPVIAAAIAFTLLPPAPSAGAQTRNLPGDIRGQTTGTYTTSTGTPQPDLIVHDASMLLTNPTKGIYFTCISIRNVGNGPSWDIYWSIRKHGENLIFPRLFPLGPLGPGEGRAQSGYVGLGPGLVPPFEFVIVPPIWLIEHIFGLVPRESNYSNNSFTVNDVGRRSCYIP